MKLYIHISYVLPRQVFAVVGCFQKVIPNFLLESDNKNRTNFLFTEQLFAKGILIFKVGLRPHQVPSPNYRTLAF